MASHVYEPGKYFRLYMLKKVDSTEFRTEQSKDNNVDILHADMKDKNYL